MNTSPAVPAEAAAGNGGATHRIELRGSLGNLMAVNAGSAVGAAALVGLLIYLYPGIGGEVFPAIYGLCLLYIVLDTLHWRWRGVHRATVESDALHVYRGDALRHERIPLSEITDVHLHRRVTRLSLQILRGGRVLRVPHVITLFPGRKVWITSDAFDKREFKRFAGAMLVLARWPGD